MEQSTRTAFDIYSKLVRGEYVDNETNKELFRSYRMDSFIQRDLEEFVSIADFKLYFDDTNGLFLVPIVSNRVNGYSNENLRKAMKLLNNEHLRLAYFVMYNVAGVFYVQNNTRTGHMSIRTTNMINLIDEKLGTMVDKSEETENEESFKLIAQVWDNMPMMPKSNRNRESVDENATVGEGRIPFVNRVLSFMCNNKLLLKARDTNEYYTTKRFETIIENYFDERDVKNILTEMVRVEVTEGDL